MADKEENTKQAKTESPYDVMLEFAYFIQKRNDQSLNALIQRISIAFAANIALAGFYLNFFNESLSKFYKSPCYIYVAIIFIIPLLIILTSVIFLINAFRYKPHKSINPGNIISMSFEKKRPDEIKREIAASYSRDWTDFRSKFNIRSRNFNISAVLSLTALFYMVILIIVIKLSRG